jgi:hypothetical protein
MLKLLDHYLKGPGKVLEGGLGKAFGFVLNGWIHLALLAKRNDALLGQQLKINFARHVHVMLHSKYCQF